MATHYKTQSGGGCLSKLFYIVVIIPVLLVGMLVYHAASPQDLSDVGGYSPSTGAVKTRDLRAILEKASKRDSTVILSETEVNLWLRENLVAKQGGKFGKNISLDAIWVRFEDGYAELIMQRTIMGTPFTSSMYVQIEQKIGENMAKLSLHGGPYWEELPMIKRGGHFGRLEVPQGFLLLVLPSYKKLAAAFPEELELAFTKIARCRFERDRIAFDSRQTLGDQGMPAGFSPRNLK
ncbi:MAG: hypothetical protein HC845_11625 [Akkermansiaceae bacterium]|nr:hypothetical protein [Akkermansiaceae bacterium]